MIIAWIRTTFADIVKGGVAPLKAYNCRRCGALVANPIEFRCSRTMCVKCDRWYFGWFVYWADDDDDNN